MGKKNSIWNNTIWGYALKHLLIAGTTFIVLLLAGFFLLNIYTNHSKKINVPELKSLKTEDAVYMLNSIGLKAKVIDSVYVKGRELGTVIEQNPAPNTIVKPGRPIYLIVNSKSLRQISLPNMRDVSLRQARAVAMSVGLQITSVQYASSEYRDLVLDVLHNGTTLHTGDKIEEGSSIVLVVGDGAGSYMQDGVPFLLGFDLTTATDIIQRSGLHIDRVLFDEETGSNSDDFIVYRQIPEPYSEIGGDSLITIFMSKDTGRIRPGSSQADDLSGSTSQPPNEKKKDVKDIEEFF